MCFKLLRSHGILRYFPAHVFNCSVDTESWSGEMTVRRIISTFCSLQLKWIVFLHSSLLRNSPLSKALEARIIGWAGPENSVRFYQQFCPKSTRLIRISSVPFPQNQVPRMTIDRAEICEHNSQIREHYFYTSLHFLFLPYIVVEHWHEDDPAFELLWFTLLLFHEFMNLFEEAKCCESWEYVSLELHRFSINTIQIFQMISQNTT